MIVIVTGASGTGKSVLVEKLSKKHRLKPVFASDILRQLREKNLKTIKKSKTKKNIGWWESAQGQKYLDERLKNTKFDRQLDKELLKLIRRNKNLVLDSRTMPWLSPVGFKVLLKASMEERAKRIVKRDKITAAEAKRAIKKKARIERKLYKKLYGFDQEKDLAVFDLIVNTAKINEMQVFRKVDTALKELY